ncbi:hypothetical protein ACM26V_18765 [Salipaludibacillus sp. HK11]|uniref:hypothetical protein n=1 Tax=Salipaludibacillus sp. HK11 TaxID=3394320 RepID=UPI0039FD17A3
MRPNLKLITMCFFMFPVFWGVIALSYPEWDSKFTNLTFITITILTFTFMPASYGSMQLREATGGLEVMNVMMSLGFISFALFFIVFWHPLVIKLKNPEWRAQDYRSK